VVFYVSIHFHQKNCYFVDFWAPKRSLGVINISGDRWDLPRSDTSWIIVIWHFHGKIIHFNWARMWKSGWQSPSKLVILAIYNEGLQNTWVKVPNPRFVFHNFWSKNHNFLGISYFEKLSWFTRKETSIVYKEKDLSSKSWYQKPWFFEFFKLVLILNIRYLRYVKVIWEFTKKFYKPQNMALNVISTQVEVNLPIGWVTRTWVLFMWKYILIKQNLFCWILNFLEVSRCHKYIGGWM